MRLLIHRAIFGDHEGCHAILATSLDKSELLSELSGRTDRPPYYSPGLNWEPFERGFVIGQWYAVCRTFQNPEASRGGMVSTFAVIAPLSEVAAIGNFSALLKQLPVSRSDGWLCRASEIELAESAPGGVFPKEVPGVARLIHELIGRKDTRMPVALVGQAGAREALTALWDALWPAMRRRFQFDLLFVPTDLERLGLTVAVIPETAALIWPNGSALVRVTEPNFPDSSPVEAALLHEPGGEPIRTLLRKLEVDPEDFRALQQAALCVVHQDGLAQANPGDIHGYLGLLAALAPDPAQGASVKAAALQKWIGLGAKFRAADVLALRNFPSTCFVRGGAITDDLIAQWLQSHILRISSADETAEIVLQALKSDPYCRIWNEAVLREVTNVLSGAGAKITEVLWRWWAKDWQLGRFSATHLPTNAVLEQALVATCPETLSEEVAKPARALAAARGWGELHATICAVTLPADEAFKAQLALRQAANSGLEILATHFSATATLKAALSSGDARLIALAGKRCSKEPTLISTFDIEELHARQVLLAALGFDSGLWARLHERRAILHRLLDLVIKGETVEAPLLERLSATAEADLCEYKNRKDVWSCLPSAASDGFMRATAAGWIAAYRSDPGATALPEKHLADIILRSPFRERLLAINAPGDIAAGLRAFKNFSQLDEPAMLAWLRRLIHPQQRHELGHREAEGLGVIIVRNKWSEAAQHLRAALSGRRDLAPALRECVPLFGLFDRLSIRLALPGKSLLDANEFWSGLEIGLLKIYPQGPMQEKIWSRAGGDESTLDQHGSGRQQWEAAVRILRGGGGGKHFTAQKLLAKSASDFPRNEQFSLLEKYAREADI